MSAPKRVEAESLAQAMALAFAEIEAATKAANNPHFKTKYADLTSVIGAIKPALVAHNLFFTQQLRPNDHGVEVETVLHHAGGDSMSLGSLFVPADRNNAQGFGSALTYARRYALVTAFGVPVEDDDGNAASKGEQPRKARQEAKDAFPDGPAPNITALRKMIDGLWQAVEDTEDYAALERLCTDPDNRAIMSQASRLTHPPHRELWVGDGMDNPGLRGLIEQRKLALSDNILAAG